MTPGRVDDAFTTAGVSVLEDAVNHESQPDIESSLFKPRQRPYNPHLPVKVSLTSFCFRRQTGNSELGILTILIGDHSWSWNRRYCSFHSDLE